MDAHIGIFICFLSSIEEYTAAVWCISCQISDISFIMAHRYIPSLRLCAIWDYSFYTVNNVGYKNSQYNSNF
jgi:hypothetical protein